MPVHFFTEGYLLEAHDLAERFNDASRILEDRFRLTWQGERFARFLFGEESQ